MNSASRILAIYEQVMTHSDGNGVQFLQLWIQVFQLGENNEDEATAALMAFRSEIELARTKLIDNEVPEELFRDCFARIKNITSTTLLNQEWAPHKRGLPPDVLLGLKWAAWALPKEEDELRPEELASLISELDALQESIATSSLSAYVKDFVLRQIGLIRTALRQYRIGGIAPVEAALEATYGAVRRSSTVLSKQVENATPEDKTLLTQFKTVLSKTAETADKVDKVRKGGEALASIGHVVGEAFDGIVKILT